MRYIHNGILLSRKKEEVLPFAIAWMDLESIMVSEISQPDKDKYHMISLTCGICEQTELTNKTETDS